MNKMGSASNAPSKKKNIFEIIGESKIYKLVSRIFSITCTLVLVFLIVLGATMFYFNMQSKSAKERGLEYTAPFGLYTIVSGSMEPNVHVYDVVVSVATKDLSQIRVGDIITFISSWDVNYGSVITHRVVSISKTENGTYQFATKGDNNQTADGAVVTQDNLVGKVVMRIPQLGRLQFFLATKMGWFVVVFIPAMIVVILDVIKIFKLRILNNNINNITDVKEVDKTYFENERLDNRDLSDDKLSKTTIVELPIEKEVKLMNDTNVKLKEDGSKEKFVRKPLKSREDNQTNNKGTNKKKSKK